MKKIVYSVNIILLLNLITIFAQSANPKREFRGAWIATVVNIDWPTKGASTSSQKQALINILDGLKAVNINAVMFQIRPECDALYKSDIEPWSHWLTGVQGQPPNPFYDPLQFAIEESHKRGIELHAWFNPYRAKHPSYSYSRAANHVTNLHPEWVITKGTNLILDPGIPAVRNYVLSVIMDVVNRYDVDGIHFDDYFYLDGMGSEDAATYATYGSGFNNIGDWRRDNVNTLIKMVNDSIQTVKPWVKWGVSPRGFWRTGYPVGTSGNDNYSAIYCDAMSWLRAKSIDYINPQLYWAFGGSFDYGKLMPWWADSAGVNNRHMYVGHAVYKIGAGASPPYLPFYANEVPKQIRLNRTDQDCQGSVLYNTTSTLANLLGFYDSLKVLYKYPALPPAMSWKDQIKPNPPLNLRYDKLADARGDGLFWDAPSVASDGDTASMYAVYKFSSPAVQQSDIDNSANLNNIVGTTFAALRTDDVSQTMYFAISSLDRNYNESNIGEIIPVQVNVPVKPIVLFPAELALNQRDTITFIWENTTHSNFDRLQIALDENFSSTNIIIDQKNIIDTFKTVTGLNGLSTYYWRVTASNLAGESIPSDVRSFTTGFPVPPQLLLPINQSLGVTLEPTLVWNKTNTAQNYRLQVAEGLSIIPSLTIIDTVLADTLFVLPKLKENKIYTWSVIATNTYGSSSLAEVFKFKTLTSSAVAQEESIPTSYVLNQNYPNPFNPITRISFSIPENGFTVIKIYNLLGQQVEELINKDLTPGNYSVDFNAQNYPSGIYVYVLRSGSHISNKKMMLIK